MPINGNGVILQFFAVVEEGAIFVTSCGLALSEVDRDDLADQGAAHVAATVRQLKQRLNSL